MPASAPNLLTLPFTHWQAPPLVYVTAAAACLLYGWGALRARPWAPRASCSFTAGVAVVVVALQSGLEAYDNRMLSAHMLQHVLLLMVAPPLLLLGKPVLLASRALPARRLRAFAAALGRTRTLTHPAACLTAFTVVVVGFHLPPIFDAAVRHPLVHGCEHAAFLAAGLFLWWPLCDGDPAPGRRLSSLGRVLYMLAAMVPEDLIGAYLNRAAAVVYAPYAASAHALGFSALLDQQKAGAIMWVGSSCIMAAGGLCSAMATMAIEERESSAATIEMLVEAQRAKRIQAPGEILAAPVPSDAGGPRRPR